jgi:hypothetical protein
VRLILREPGWILEIAVAVQTLAQRLAPFAQLAALKATVETFYASLQAARNTQQGTEGEGSSASDAAKDARLALAVGLYAKPGPADGESRRRHRGMVYAAGRSYFLSAGTAFISMSISCSLPMLLA